MSTSEGREAAIDPLNVELAQYSALPLGERAQWREVITASRQALTELLRAQAAAVGNDTDPDFILRASMNDSTPLVL